MLYEQFEEVWGTARKRQVIFFYIGDFSQQVVAAIAETVKARLDAAGAAGPTRRRIFSSFVEMSHNIMHYSSEHLSEGATQVRRGSLCIGTNGDGFYLLSANPVDRDSIESIRSHLAPLHAMSVDEIKSAYSQALRREAPPDSKGAGLGFLTLARDASAPLEFEFVHETDDAGTAVFCIKAAI